MRLRMLAVLIFPFAFLLSLPETPRIQFAEIAAPAGVNFILNASPTAAKHQPETMAGGVALLDYNADGLLDIYLVNGATIPGLQKTGPEYHNRLFRNNGNLTFTDVTAQAHAEGVGYGMGVAVGDFDNDGFPDIFLANVNGNQLLRNNRDGTFSDATARSGLSGALHNGKKMWSVAAAWLDYNRDGLLDLFVSNYCEWDPAQEPVCAISGQRAYCNPQYYKPLPNTLYRNNGDGTFTDVSTETGIAAHLGRNMGIGVADYDRDGFPDIFVAGDKTPALLFHNRAGSRFDEVGLDQMVAYSENGSALSGMGVDFRDVNNDGRPDLWYSAVERQTFPMFFRTASSFSNVTRSVGLARATEQMSGWSNGIFDFDNDGWKDLFVARSNVLDNVAISSGRSYFEPNSVFRNIDGMKFEEVAAFSGDPAQLDAAHRGAAFGDLDNDGQIDVVVSVLNGPAKVFHNVTGTGRHWLEINLKGVYSNRMGLGAQLMLTLPSGQKLYNAATTAVGYASSSDSRVHFGLGDESAIDSLQVLWPSGITQTLRHVAVDRVLTVTESRQP